MHSGVKPVALEPWFLRISIMSPLSVGANAGTQDSDQWMNIPNFAS